MSVQWWQARLYPDAAAQDPVGRFIRFVERHVRPEDEVLDLGAGAGELNRYAFKGKVKRMIGVDLDPRVTTNPLLDQGLTADVTRLPFEDNSFDLAFSIYVLEHLPDPTAFVNEVRRVLRPGGLFLALTPNRFHYVCLIASLTTTSFHQWYNRRRGRNDEDTFPTLYRLNSRTAMRKHFGTGGFEVAELSMIEVQPNYLKFSTPSFLMGAAYERLVNSSSALEGLRVNIIAAFRNGSKARDGVPG